MRFALKQSTFGIGLLVSFHCFDGLLLVDGIPISVLTVTKPHSNGQAVNIQTKLRLIFNVAQQDDTMPYRAQYLLSLFLLFIPSLSSAESPLPHPPVIEDVSWNDPDLDRAQALFRAGQWRRSSALLKRTMARIQLSVSSSFLRAHTSKVGPSRGPGPLRPIMTKYVHSPRPILFVHSDRFLFSPDLYRMLAWAQASSGDIADSAHTFQVLLSTPHANKTDRINARALFAK